MAEEIKIPTKFKKIVTEIETMSVLDLSELVKILEEKFGVSAAPQVVAGAVAQAGEEAPKEEAKSEFNIILTGVGEKKIEVIKAVRDVLQIGLKEAKDLVDGAVSAPATIKEKDEKLKNIVTNPKYKEELNELQKKVTDKKMKIAIKYFFLKGKNMTKIFVRLNNIRKRNK